MEPRAFFDGSSREISSKARWVLESLEKHKLNCSLRFEFNSSNDTAEYEAILTGIRLVKEMHESCYSSIVISSWW